MPTLVVHIKRWLVAARLPSIMLAMSSVIMGSILAFWEGKWNFWISLWTFVTASLLQIIANLANDYGDFIHGGGVGNRVVAEGEKGITLSQLKIALVWLIVVTLLAGLLLLKASKLSPVSFLRFSLLGGVSILAAITYTIGPKPYAYIGLGDLSVFLFFGLVGVVGTAYLHTHVWNIAYLLPACSCGCLAVAVLNLNNIRDISLDAEIAKKTLVVRMGRKMAIYYQWILLLGGIIAPIIFTYKYYYNAWQWLFIGGIPRLIQSGIMAMQLKPEQLDGVLQRLMLAYLYFVLLFSAGIICSVLLI